MITRSSIAFEDFLGSSIAPQVMPPWQRTGPSENNNGILSGARGGVNERQVDMFCLGLDMKCVSTRLHLVGIIRWWLW